MSKVIQILISAVANNAHLVQFSCHSRWSADGTEGLPCLPLDFLHTEMRLEIELCIFHEAVNASVLTASAQSGLCFALSIPTAFYNLTAYSWSSKQA